MRELMGKAVSPGYANGKVFVYNRGQTTRIPRYHVTDDQIDGEHRRFHAAIDRSIRELKQLEERVFVELGESQSAIFAAHLGLLEDHHFQQRVESRVLKEHVNLEQALDDEVSDLCEMIASVKDDYLRDRAQDIRDVGRRIMRQLAAKDGGRYIDLPPQSVIVARELLPSETLDLDREHVVGIVTEEGGENSHAAILARALGIPAVTGIVGAMSSIPAGVRVLVDGERGIVSINPDQAAMADFTVLQSCYDEANSTAIAAEALECAMLDGTRISLLGNINRPHESRSVIEHRLDGVGLFRTEFMFLDSTAPPSLERQLNAYRTIGESLVGLPVVIRTLDLGGDKLPAFLRPHREANPNLGSRGLRFSLAERSLFATQLRALLGAAEDCGNIRVLFPMVLGAGDFAEAKALVQDIRGELGTARSPLVGAMIETPASLFALDEIFQIADFACIGTNDLTQFMLAADRGASELAGDFSVLHPGVLRAIAKVIEAGRRAQREVCVCGEAASYPLTACLLAGLGVRQLSMSPLRAARVRYMLRQTRAEALKKLGNEALHARTADEVRRLLRDARLEANG